MTVNIDTHLFPGVNVDSKLIALLQEMSHYNAAFSYEAIDTVGFNENKRICAAAVFLDSQPVGKVSVGKKYVNASGTNETVFNVTSDGIRKSRGGNRNTTTSRHMKQAMRAVRESFRRAESDTVAERLISDAENKVQRMQMWARDHARNVLLKATDTILAYLQSIDDGTAQPSNGLPASVTKVLEPKWKDYLRDHRIASSVNTKFEAKYGVVVRPLRDESLQVVDLMTREVSVAKTSYDLPVHYQEKLTMLKIMEEGQPIEHVGFKFSDYDHVNGVRTDYQAFFLIDGPTYINSD